MKKQQKIFLFSILIIGIFTTTVLLANNMEILSTSSSTSSEKTMAWGIKRNSNHEQPDVGESNRKILEENGGICLGNKETKYIYLTFDSGYEAGYTEKILETLKENDVKATFFITSHYLNTASELVEKIISEGHIIGNHTPIFLMSGNDIKIKC